MGSVPSFSSDFGTIFIPDAAVVSKKVEILLMSSGPSMWAACKVCPYG